MFSLHHLHNSSLPPAQTPCHQPRSLSALWGSAMGGLPSPSSGAFTGKAAPLLLSPLPSLLMLSWLLALHHPHARAVLAISSTSSSLPPRLPPSLTALAHDVGELLWQNPSTWLGSVPHLPDAGTQLQWAADAVTHLAYMYLKLLARLSLKKIIFQINNCRHEGDWTSTTVGVKQVFFWETKVPKLVYPQLLKSFPLLCSPPLYPDVFFCGSSGQSCKISVSFLPEVAAEAASSQGAPECFCSSHMVSSRLERLQFWHQRPTDLCAACGLFIPPPSPLHVQHQVLSHGPGRVKGHGFRGKFWHPCRSLHLLHAPTASPVRVKPSALQASFFFFFCFLERNLLYCAWYLFPKRAGL